MNRSKIAAAAAFIVVVFTIGGFIRVTGFASSSFSTPSASDAPPVADSPLEERFSAFDMMRSVTTVDGTDTLRLVYADHGTWKETIISSTADPSRVGDYQELRDGTFTVFVRGEMHTADPGLGYRVPGPWFVDEQWLIQRANAAAGTTLTTSTSGTDQIVTLIKGSRQTEVRFDIATGIPVGFEISDSGTVSESHQVTALESEGQIIR